MSTVISSSPELPPAKRMRSRSPEAAKTNGFASASSSAAAPSASSTQDKAARKAEARRTRQKRKDYAKQVTKTGREPIEFDIQDLLTHRTVTDVLSEGLEYANRFERGTRLTLTISRLDAHGDGLAISPSGDWVIAVPHTLPGEKVTVEVTSNERLYSKARLVEILEKSTQRQDELVKCKYFGDCGGCQYQMIPYEQQLDIKRGVVQRAFSRFSGLDESLVPEVLSTIPSPNQYNYRTKLTPHFELPYELRRGRRSGILNKAGTKSAEKPNYDVAIGFDCIGTKRVMDIEECPIATKTINKALPEAKQKVVDSIESFKNGATILLRDSLKTYESWAEDRAVTQKVPNGEVELETEVVTDHKATVKERVLTTKFESPAGTFFQNNRSILPSLLDYVRDAITLTIQDGDRYLVDAYCGSGLFSLCLASLFREVSGVEISSESIKYATKNAELNGITNAKFLAGNAEDIFAKIQYPADQTTVIIDPPRRGCDEEFIRQLVKLAPKHIVYVSCNVHTQARDVGQLIERDARYKIRSVRGADLFPQTHHVEGVAVLEKVDAA
ncbi:related to TRM2 - tRNA(m5U54)methyltransferase [Melanopsichium pennsylvanicum]|uniref:Related to TRM2 - tRNA(M5U54)methyltransferase n=2 Tax=Melanopsichium pennsylvanicum TaxID=63383 RepID=A0AAJ5C7S4_9BASI|nr:related to TRM2-tRNA(m5U54)methyltransferase [Melanopsichium pennsylvanicum 4]SNX87211.1 related to TRM2 - tRNA(m5U54)methyltransferase [Melanopsichium pennsylvanicum]